MSQSPCFLMTDPAGFEVRYSINPWMRPEVWAAGRATLRQEARSASRELAQTLQSLGAGIAWVPAEPGLPDLVFPANAAVVLDGRALLARFRCPERRGEEEVFRRTFEALRGRGAIEAIESLPEPLFHEGAGDAIWDRTRSWFWTGFGQRSDLGAADVIGDTFGRETVPLGLASPRFYHLDTCFCPLSGGEVLYYPPAFTPKALAAIRDRVAPDARIEASPEDAAGFCVNAISLGRDLVMARAPQRLKAVLGERGYRIREIDLAPFILSGGAAFCMTLRLDLTTASEETSDADLRTRALA